MARNLADNLSLAAALAPLGAPVAGLPFLEATVPRGLLSEYYGYVWMTVIFAYLYMGILAVPTLLLTRRRIVWTPTRIILLGVVLGLAPLLAAFGWGFVESAWAGRLAEYTSSLFERDWTLFWLLAFCGAGVAASFVLIQVFFVKAPSNKSLEQPGHE